MTIKDPREFENELDALEAVERATTRMVSFAMFNLLGLATDEFSAIFAGGSGNAPTSQGEDSSDAADYLGEDLTRMALDSIGMSKVPGGRLFGAIDYKAAGLQFLPDFAVEQALLVDSKAEKSSLNNARIQVTQTSLEIRQRRQRKEVRMQGLVQPYWTSGGHSYLTSTLFVKYHYDDGCNAGLKRITVACLPHKYLQDRYNPDPDHGIWNVGPDSPARGEKFRTRLNFALLEAIAPWRVQRLQPGQTAWQFSG